MVSKKDNDISVNDLAKAYIDAFHGATGLPVEVFEDADIRGHLVNYLGDIESSANQDKLIESLTRVAIDLYPNQLKWGTLLQPYPGVDNEIDYSHLIDNLSGNYLSKLNFIAKNINSLSKEDMAVKTIEKLFEKNAVHVDVSLKGKPSIDNFITFIKTKDKVYFDRVFESVDVDPLVRDALYMDVSKEFLSLDGVSDGLDRAVEVAARPVENVATQFALYFDSLCGEVRGDLNLVTATKLHAAVLANLYAAHVAGVDYKGLPYKMTDLAEQEVMDLANLVVESSISGKSGYGSIIERKKIETLGKMLPYNHDYMERIHQGVGAISDKSLKNLSLLIGQTGYNQDVDVVVNRFFTESVFSNKNIDNDIRGFLSLAKVESAFILACEKNQLIYGDATDIRELLLATALAVNLKDCTRMHKQISDVVKKPAMFFAVSDVVEYAQSQKELNRNSKVKRNRLSM